MSDQPLHQDSLETDAFAMHLEQRRLLLEHGRLLLQEGCHSRGPAPAALSCARRGSIVGFWLLQGDHQCADVRGLPTERHDLVDEELAPSGLFLASGPRAAINAPSRSGDSPWLDSPRRSYALGNIAASMAPVTSAGVSQAIFSPLRVLRIRADQDCRHKHCNPTDDGLLYLRPVPAPAPHQWAERGFLRPDYARGHPV
jgi:hypothetical protein